MTLKIKDQFIQTIKQLKEKLFKNALPIAMISIILILLYGNYSNHVFSQDSYTAYFASVGSRAGWNMILGRFVQSFFCCFINEAVSQRITFIMVIAFFVVSFCVVYFTLIKDICSRKIKVGVFIGLTFLFANPFYCDWFEYPTKLGMASGVLFASLASLVYYRIQFVNKKKVFLKYLAIILLLFLASGGYQQTSEFFVIESVLLFVKGYYANKEKRRFVYILKNCFFITAFFTFNGLLTYGFMKYFLPLVGVETLRISSVNLVENINIILENMHDLWINNQGLMPNYLFLVTSILLLFMFLITAAAKKDFLGILSLALNAVMVFVAPFSVWLFTSVWMAPRTLITMMAIPGMLLIFILFLLNDSDAATKIRIKAAYFSAVAFAVLLLSVYCYKTIQVSGDLLVVNALDQNVARMYYSQIQEYETETGNTISKIAFPNKDGLYFHYKDVIQTYDTNISSFGPQWSRMDLFQYASGRKFSEESMNIKTYQKYFGNTKWNIASPEQVVCVGDTAYIAVCYPS